MQSLYEDPYGILRLVSTQPSEQKASSPFQSSEDFMKSISWFDRIGRWSLFAKNRVPEKTDSF